MPKFTLTRKLVWSSYFEQQLNYPPDRLQIRIQDETGFVYWVGESAFQRKIEEAAKRELHRLQFQSPYATINA